MPAKRSAVRTVKEILRLKFETRLSYERMHGAAAPRLRRLNCYRSLVKRSPP